MDRHRCTEAGHRTPGPVPTDFVFVCSCGLFCADAKCSKMSRAEQANSLLTSLFTSGSSHPAAPKMEPLATPPTSIVKEATQGASGSVAKKARHA
eukprot:COSAG02_NODE_4408_length_5393_cov_3.694938_4_plen_95_part_00